MENLNLEKTLCDEIEAAKAKLEASRHSEKIAVSTELSYTDNNLEESKTFIKGKTTAVYATVTVHIRGKESDEDDCYSYSIMMDLEEKKLTPEEQLERERQDFNTEINRFLELLEATDDPEALIKAESDAAEAEAAELMEKFTNDLKKLNRAVYIGVGIAVAIGLLMLVLSVVL